MLGLIKKDLLVVKANLKTLVVIFIVFAIMAIQGTFELSFVLPIIGIMLFIGTFSYDDFNHWNAYVATLPNGRKNAVRAKYITSILLTVLLGMISFGLSVMINSCQNREVSINEIVSSLMGTLLSVVIIISVMYPMIFKFGSTNGRIWMFVIVFAFMGIFSFILKMIDTNVFATIMNIVEKQAYILIPIISVILLLGSYLISSQIFEKKEF